MIKKILAYIVIFSFLSASYVIYKKLSFQEDDADIVRKLSAVRLSLTLYSINEKSQVKNPLELVKKGYLEGVPFLKLKWKFKTDAIELRDNFRVKNTGKWAYVADKENEKFGLFYIDSNRKNNRGIPFCEL